MTGTPTGTPSGAPTGADRYRESLWIEQILRKETVGGILLLVATVIAVALANSAAADGYFALRDTSVILGFGDAVFEISVGHLAADGLLAIFFFLAGLELKREFVAGELRDPRRALVPVAAAFGGAATPAVIFTLVNLTQGQEVLRGWAIPLATDIAFALAVLAVVGTSLPIAMRTFLLTLAVVDDLIGITVIAFVYTDDLQPLYLVLAGIGLAIFGLIAQRYQELFRLRSTAAIAILAPIGIVVWFLMYSSGVHATVAGVLLAFTVPVLARGGEEDGLGGREGLAEKFEHGLRPISAGFAVPVFAFFSSGVAVGGLDGLVEAITSPVAIGIVVGLVVGKTIGITLASWLVTRLPGVTLPRGVRWIDVVGLAMLSGMGFTVSLLISELSYGQGDPLDDVAKVGILLGSLIAAVAAGILLGTRNRHYRRRREEDERDSDGDGIPDAFEDTVRA
ncbi:MULTISPECIES: Na+/H+ antiporter NhaA [unclassified Microcella]|uniref:Na+/H+ antiporter NhaA n=1 Tax=unclassified Microcella TaxID=2630066 RepID=UPI0006FF57BE|nr:MULTISPECIES: Na+/H+ antiporter NhaA [unclassified Microcella]KQV24963.1 sodium:proton antiporter [Yonghaparkia sp. Root332]KRF31248.1 sodium:proton antiporter [Yonghaparkia sp. Soil809]